MRSAILAILLYSALSGVVSAQPKRVYAYESLNAFTASRAFSSTNYASGHGSFSPDTEEAYITVETGQVRWRSDSTAPTSTEGHILNAGESITLIGYPNISNFKVIQASTPSGTLKATFFRE